LTGPTSDGFHVGSDAAAGNLRRDGMCAPAGPGFVMHGPSAGKRVSRVISIEPERSQREHAAGRAIRSIRSRP